jgi:hypothetical protein
MENSNFAQNRGGVSFLSIAPLQYISAPTDNCGFVLQILTKTLLDISECLSYLSYINRNRNMWKERSVKSQYLCSSESIYFFPPITYKDIHIRKR